MLFKALAALLALLAAPTAAQSLDNLAGGHTDAVLERLHNAKRWRDHIMVVGHRAGVRENGVVVRPENSLEAIRAAIDMGLEMVELDVEQTADGVYVVHHDSWLDRTTTCTGRLIEKAYADLADCRLRRGDFGPATDEPLPPLRGALSAAKGRVLVNIDNKREVGDLPAMIAIAHDLGLEEQILVKANLWSEQKVAEAVDLLGALGSHTNFMPILADDAVKDPALAENAARRLGASAIAMVNWRRQAGSITSNGGALFSPHTRAAAVRNDFHLWVSTYSIINKPAGHLSGGRGDQLATLAANPDDVFGFWVERGATIIQTDEPKAALEWLEANGYRRPYEVDGAKTASIN